MFEILEHPADIGFRTWGKTAAELFQNAAVAMVSIAIDLSQVSPRREYPLAAAGEDYESLLVNWLSEILYWTDGHQTVLGEFQVNQIEPTRVSGIGRGEPRDPERHPAKVIVKAVTYHQLKVIESPDGWQAEVYLDI
jgi:SHS2 domain-containing protein